MKKELDFVKDMFDKIAPRYDFLNRLLSLRQDIFWRTQMVKAAGLAPDSRILDVACGTCDVALEAFSRLRGRASVVGVDFSLGMLHLGKTKISGTKGIALVNGDALNLSFRPDTFDAVFIAFGIRNIMDRKGAVEEFYKVLKPGGRLAVLELSTPEKGILRRIYLAYFRKILPMIGSLFSKDDHAYSYLPESVLKFPSAVDFSKTIKAAGFRDIRFRPMSLGIVTLFVGIRQ
ncbi:bifunctional demethylmenaquinone methyltransferase/2-methoxy-6-polyprenyl-1,4-benzoquinol methylase UbiE [Desulfospira joergensenii]|uniref:bifunctional demethylmenaquinone methyltransferase/2-methoxy-6-polyprenyl-1,4-benzoquinol methylase UbiE n=1 Tax=Desulfospira joergensenii TaxID=53329 RepID=UPI0003B59EDE|nr:bifunctional demethylmenaquinone methyltransferase/2-methoxy-6-polyprenyl-1,4-benzoquinol methylase UbiE [Desulfospira joergensenii]